MRKAVLNLYKNIPGNYNSADRLQAMLLSNELFYDQFLPLVYNKTVLKNNIFYYAKFFSEPIYVGNRCCGRACASLWQVLYERGINSEIKINRYLVSDGIGCRREDHVILRVNLGGSFCVVDPTWKQFFVTDVSLDQDNKYYIEYLQYINNQPNFLIANTELELKNAIEKLFIEVNTKFDNILLDWTLDPWEKFKQHLTSVDLQAMELTRPKLL